MVTTEYKPTATDTQHAQIRRALVTAINHGWIEWESVEDPLSAEDEFAALGLLTTHRAKLKKLGVTFPTKGQYNDRLDIIATGPEAWTVHNLTKGTEYEVTLSGLRLDCSCSKAWGSGWCKHRESVEAWRDEHGAVGPFGGAEVEPEPDDEWVDDSDPRAAMLQVMGWSAAEINHTTTAPRTYDFAPHWTAAFPPSDEQSAALQAMAQWWDGSEPIFRLTGSAGTGKSTMSQSFIRYLRALTLPPKIAVAAPINKAKKVQQKILREWGLCDIPTHTCAQLFGVKRSIIDGEEVFAPDPKAYAYYQDYGVIFVDESSTINLQLWEMLLDACHGNLINPVRFVVMGDPAQLPPINEGESMAFRHKCLSAHLSEVQRYDGAIAVLADDVRRNLDRPVFPAFTSDFDPETKKGIYSVDRGTWESLIRKVFTGDVYRDNPDSAKILAYTNKRVDALNILVRNALGYRAPWVVGERIIALGPYAPADDAPPALSTSDEATITGLYEGSTGEVECWFLRLDNGETIPVPRNPAQFEARLKELRQAKAHGKYWALKECMASVTYAYALTVHRSQGSTYSDVFVDVGDFAKCKGSCRTEGGQRVLERNQLLYVALTRPSERLIIST